MKIALAQMRMTGNVQENLEKSLKFCDLAEDCDLLFFPEIQLSPFFPQYEKQDAEMYVMEKNGQEIAELAGKAKEHQYYLSPNVYLKLENQKYDASLWIGPDGRILDVAKMVHIAQAEQFYEQDYYAIPEAGAEKAFELLRQSLLWKRRWRLQRPSWESMRSCWCCIR